MSLSSMRTTSGPGTYALRCNVYESGKKERAVEDFSAISDILLNPDVFVWFDVTGPRAESLALISEEFNLHPLAVEDAVKAHQRPKIEAYEGYWFIVMHGVTIAEPEGMNIHEIAIFVGKNFVVTVRADPAYPFDELRHRLRSRGKDDVRTGLLLYSLLDTIVDAYFLVTDRYKDELDRIESLLFSQHYRKRDLLLKIFTMKKDLQRFRHVVVPVRDILTSLTRGDMHILRQEDMPYYRDVYDHAVRVIDQMDAARDITASALDLQFSLASNQQSEITKQLTIIATIFLPLTYLTGFFGQNFAFLTESVKSPEAFFAFGLGGEALAFSVLLLYFRYKRWL